MISEPKCAAPEVLLTDAEQRSVLAACRGLRAGGYRVSAVSGKRPAATHWSRCCAERHALPDPLVDPQAFVGRLEDLVKRRSYAVLLTGSDASLLAVSESRERFESATTLGLPSRAVVRRILQRDALYEQAASVGLPAPASVLCASAAEASRAARELRFPVIVKPARSLVPVNGGMRQLRSLVASDETSLARVLPRFVPPFLIQSYLHDRSIISCAGVLVDGELRALAVSKYLRTWPADAGSASLSETIVPPDGLATRLEKLLRGLGWQGIFEVELLALGAGEFSVIDLNPRPYGSMSLALAAGANLAAIWCDHLLGRNGPLVVARPLFRYRWEDGEILHLVSNLRHGRFRDAAAIMRPYRRVTYAQFRVTDPAPLAARSIYIGGRLLSRLRSAHD